jgi:hypothetical protein
MRSPRIAAIALAALVSLPVFAAERKLRPGQYELKTEMKMEGVDRQIPPTTITHCYTEQDVKDYKKMAQEGQGRSHECEISDMKETGGHVSYSMNCKSGAKGTAEMAFEAEGYDMTMNLETPGGPHGAMKMKMHTTARRTGDCAK